MKVETKNNTACFSVPGLRANSQIDTQQIHRPNTQWRWWLADLRERLSSPYVTICDVDCAVSSWKWSCTVFARTCRGGRSRLISRLHSLQSSREICLGGEGMLACSASRRVGHHCVQAGDK